MSTLATVNGIKESLSRELDNDNKGDDGNETSSSSVDRMKDMLGRLEECDVTLDILTQSLIGTVVSKLKTHQELGPTAKALVKKWKKVAKNSSSGGNTSSSGSKSAEAIAAASASANNDANKPKKKAKAVVRRESLPEEPPAEAAAEWADLAPPRQNICQKFYSFLKLAKSALVKSGVNEQAVDHLTAPRAAEIEGALYRKLSRDKRAYADKARSLAFNLKKNSQLCQDVILGTIPAEDLVVMSSEQMASAETLKKRADESRKLIESKRLDWEQANEDKINEMCGIKGDLLKASLFTCGRCKSVKTTSTQKQTRSADEPMTVFVLCLNCGKRWKC